MASKRTGIEKTGPSPRKILLIEEDPKDVRLIRKWLRSPDGNHFNVE